LGEVTTSRKKKKKKKKEGNCDWRNRGLDVLCMSKGEGETGWLPSFANRFLVLARLAWSHVAVVAKSRVDPGGVLPFCDFIPIPNYT
jgi:hypothetical protein